MASEHRWSFFLNGAATWRAMLAACRAARHSIDFEQYIFKDDEIGREFIDVFVEKARAGVRVRLLVDAVGGIFLSAVSAGRMRHAGVRILFFKPFRSWLPHRISSWFFRDHRKILVVDSKVAFTGGVGVNARMRDWRDTDIRIEGLLVTQFEDSFLRMWQFAETRRFKKFPRNLFSADGFTLETSAPHLRQNFIRKSLLHAIRSAERYVYLTTPYLIPDLRLLRAIRRAARRGVDVRILVPGVSDHFWLDMATASYFDLLFRGGVRMYRYQSGSVLHAKTAVVDDCWATTGSTNWDNLSLRLNYEANITSTNPDFARELKAHFLGDLKVSEEVIPAAWKRRPLYLKVLEALTWPVHGIL